MLADELDYVLGVDTHRDDHVLAVVTAPAGAVVAGTAAPTHARGYRELLRLAPRHGRVGSGGTRSTRDHAYTENRTDPGVELRLRPLGQLARPPGVGTHLRVPRVPLRALSLRQLLLRHRHLKESFGVRERDSYIVHVEE